MPTAPRAPANAATLPTGTSRPVPRNMRAKATAIRSTPVNGPPTASGPPATGPSGTDPSATTQQSGADQLAHSRRSEPLLVLPVLEHGPERHLDGVLVEVGAAQGGQRGRPVDGLRDPGRFVQLH